MVSHKQQPPGGEPLPGGTANRGRVTRSGNTVRRPRTPQSELVQHYLAHLRAQGLAWVPKPLGFVSADPAGTQPCAGHEVLSWLPGKAAADNPAAHTDDLLREVATLHLQLHEAAKSYLPANGPWAQTAADYFPARATIGERLVMGHNDLNPSNVLVSDNHAGHRPGVTGIVDWDYVRPVDPRFDIAVAMRHWVGLESIARTPLNQTAAEATSDKVLHRFDVLLRAYELNKDDRGVTLGYIVAFLQQARTNVAALARAGRPGFAALIENGYEQTNRAMVTWMTTHLPHLSDG